MRLGRFHIRFSAPAARRHRRIIIACLITVGVILTLLGLITVIRWRSERAIQGDTRTLASQASVQLSRGLTSRRGTLTFIRDTLNRQPDLTKAQLEALGASATKHTRHLLGTGLIRDQKSPDWWYGPKQVSSSEKKPLSEAIRKRSRLRGVWNVPSTFITTVSKDRPLLVMLEPLKASGYRRSAIIGIFDLKPLLEDFVVSRLPHQHPVLIADGEIILFQSPNWKTHSETDPQIIVEDTIKIDAERWTVKMQPGVTHVVRALSWYNILVVSLSMVAGIFLTIIVWILATRTLILERAVQRRTAALRRTSNRLRQLATTDELTGLHNRRFFLDRWSWECDRATRYRRPLACLMVDVNGFKQVNDRLGHHAGDLVLKDVAKELRAALRQSDILARFGGDEFIVALPETSIEQAEAVAEKLRQVAIHTGNGDEQRRSPTVRLSVGVSQVTSDKQAPDEIIQAADQALYSTKRQSKAKAARARSHAKH